MDQLNLKYALRSPPWTVSFFFQAEDGIRDLIVTGVQTCALPISHDHRSQDQEHVEEHGKHLTSPCSDGRIAIVLLRLEDEPNGPGEPLAPRQPPPPVRMMLGKVRA